MHTGLFGHLSPKTHIIRPPSTLPTLLLLSLLSFSAHWACKGLARRTLSQRPLLTRALTGLWFAWISLASLSSLWTALHGLGGISHFTSTTNTTTTTDTDLEITRSALYSLFGTLLCYSTGLRFMASLSPVRHAFPKHYQASFDGEAIWATVLHSYTTPQEVASLLPLVLFKYLDIAMGSLGILLGVSFSSSLPRHSPVSRPNPIRSLCDWLSYTVHIVRRVFYVWALFLGPGVPWLLWVPNCLVILFAIILEIHLALAGDQSSSSSSSSPVQTQSPSPVLQQSKKKQKSPRKMDISGPKAKALYKDFLAVTSTLASPGLVRRLKNRDDPDGETDEEDDDEWTLEEDGLDSDSSTMTNDTFDSSSEGEEENDSIPSTELLDLLRDASSTVNDDGSLPHYLSTSGSIFLSSPPMPKTAKTLSKRLERLSGRVNHLQTILFNPLDRVMMRGGGGQTSSSSSSSVSSSRIFPGTSSSTSSSLTNTTTATQKCVSCKSGQRTVVLLPCQHLSLCGSCKEELEGRGGEACPICGTGIDGSVCVFWTE